MGQRDMKTHDFQTSLKFSHDQADAPWWTEIYQKAFPTLQLIQDVRQDGWAQRAGIDRRLHLRDGSTVHVDEKVREKDWPDILLERWSDRDRRTPGWIQKELNCDYIAYAFIPTQTCYLLPYRTLQRVWWQKGRGWIALAEADHDGFHVVEARNAGWVTESIAVPIQVLLDTIRDALTVRWSA